MVMLRSGGIHYTLINDVKKRCSYLTFCEAAAGFFTVPMKSFANEKRLSNMLYSQQAALPRQMRLQDCRFNKQNYLFNDKLSH